jgi:hypothetical protein
MIAPMGVRVRRCALAAALACVASGALVESVPATAVRSREATSSAPLALAGEPAIGGKGIALTLECGASAGQSCEGEGALERAPSVSAGGLSLGTVAFVVGASARKTVLLPYNGALLRLLGRDRELAVTLTVTLKGGAAPTVVASEERTILALNTRAVARAIRRSILVQRGIHASVSCPRTVIQAKGNNFVCYASTSSYIRGHRERSRTPFRVTQKNDEGDVFYAS